MQRKVPQGQADEGRLTDDVIELADKYGRYGYFMGHPWLRHWSERAMDDGLLKNAGWHVNHKRVQRIWQPEGLKVRQYG